MKALIWDVDGTLAETELDGHRVAFNQAFESLGLPWRWDEAHYGRLLAVTGGRERLLHDMMSRTDAPVLLQQRQALAGALHAEKNRRYAQLVERGAIGWRPGVLDLMHEARARGLRQAVATTTSRSNLEALLQSQFGADAARWFEVRVCGEDVQRKKPDPEVYLIALQRLGLEPLEAVAMEDSPGGAAAARAAGLPVIVTPSRAFADATIDGATAIGPGLHTRQGWRPALRPFGSEDGRVTLDDLLDWCAQGDTVSQFA